MNKPTSLTSAILAVAAVAVLIGVGTVVLSEYVEEAPPCDQSCTIQFIQLRDAQHGHYQTSLHLSAALRQAKVDVASYYKNELEKCMFSNKRFTSGVDAVVASVKRYLIIRGVKEPGLSRILKAMRAIGVEAQMKAEGLIQ